MQSNVALALGKDIPFSFRSVDMEHPRSTEVLVRMVASGICHTDISAKQEALGLPLPMVLGHEGSGVVEAIGTDVTHVQPGDHVVLSGDSCGICRKCHLGLTSYCDEFVERNLTGLRTDGSSPFSRDGELVRGRFCGQSSFASHTVVPARSAVKVPHELPLELLGPLGCGLITGVGTVMNALKPIPGSTLAVFGVGTVGLAAIMGGRLTGCEQIIAVDPNPSRLQLAKQLGATHTLGASPEVANEILELTRGGADYSVECSGHTDAIQAALACLGRPAWCAQVGAPPMGTSIELDIGPVGYGRGIRGVVLGETNPQAFVPYLARLYQDGQLPFEALVTYYNFADIDQAFADAIDGTVIKPILTMQEHP